MASWIKSRKIIGGILIGNVFGSPLNVSDYNWVTPPGNTTGYCTCNESNTQTFGGVDIPWESLPIDTDITFAILDVTLTDPETAYKRQVVLKGQKRGPFPNGQYVIDLYRPKLRNYTDATTYTETDILSLNTRDCHIYPQGSQAASDYRRYIQSVKAVFCLTVYNTIPVMICGLLGMYVRTTDSELVTSTSFWSMTQHDFYAVLGGEIPDEVYSPEFGNESEPDGYGVGGVIGSHDKHSDHSGIPAKPQYGFTSAGFLNHYRISAQGLSMLGEALFPEPVGASSSVEEAIDKLIANSWNSKILDYIVDCRIIPVTPTAPTQEYITCGGKVLVHPTTHQQYTAYLINEDFVDVDCGYVETPLVEGNFLDFYNLKCKLFLPFYGYVDIEPEYWMGAKIGVYYRFNCMDGSFMCWVTSKAFRSGMNADDVIGQYSGNACIHIPISSQSYSQIVNGLITTGASVVGAVAGGAAGGKIAGTIASGAATAITSRPTLNKSNSYSGSSALMSKRTPYLLIEFNEAQFSRRYVDEQGLPAVVTKTLGECQGFTQASNPILDGIPCTENEKERIRAALASGLIFK